MLYFEFDFMMLNYCCSLYFCKVVTLIFFLQYIIRIKLNWQCSYLPLTSRDSVLIVHKAMKMNKFNLHNQNKYTFFPLDVILCSGARFVVIYIVKNFSGVLCDLFLKLLKHRSGILREINCTLPIKSLKCWKQRLSWNRLFYSTSF